MTKQEHVTWIQGVVERSEPFPMGFAGTVIQCNDGAAWVISYDSRAPYHQFAGRHVQVSGKPRERPKRQTFRIQPELIGWKFDPDERPFGHWDIAAIRLVDITNGDQLLGVGQEQILSGRFRKSHSEGLGPSLTFVTDSGERFFVFNDEINVVFEETVEVSLYPLQLAPSMPKSELECCWIVYPTSMDEDRRRFCQEHWY